MGRLTDAQFSAIVDDVADSMRTIQSATAHGFNAHITFASRSGRSSVEASLHFDAESGRCTAIRCPYTTANQPHFFADEVERRIDLL